MVEDNFVEVDTPILQPQAGGALARPFLTHANALDMDLSLRIAPELYLKRLVVGGYERVFEIARNFRNEGIDTRHSPEFTALEAYQAFGDSTEGMALTERLVVAAAEAATGRMTYEIAGRPLDLTPPWPKRPLLDWLEEVVGRRLHPTDPVEDVRAACERARRRLPARVGLRQAHLRALRHRAAAAGHRPGDGGGVPGGGVTAGPGQRRRPDDGGPVRALHRRPEFANGYSELNVPEEQQARFQAMAAAGPRGTPRPTRPTRPSCAPSSTACRRPRGSASGSTGW